MPTKADVRKAVITQAEERVKPESKSCFPYNVRDFMSSPKAPQGFVKLVGIDTLRSLPKGLPKGKIMQDATAVKKLQLREAKILSKVHAFLSEENYDEVVSCTSSIILAKQQFGEKCKHPVFATTFNSINVEIFRARAEAYFELKQYQSCVDDTNAGLELVSAFAQMGSEKESEKDAILEVKKWQCALLHLRASGSKSLGDINGAFIDLRAVVALVHESGWDVHEGLQSDIMTLMSQMKRGCPRPHYTDAEIRAWNKELQLKIYAPKNRICANCGKHSSADVILKLCGGCKLAWFCGYACSHTCWPTHKVQCKNPDRKRYTVVKEACFERKEIAERGYFLVWDDNGPASVMHDGRTGRYYESLSDQDVFFVTTTDDPAALEKEILHQRNLWDEEPPIA